jgi:two-component system sensor histidine kinase KdpD
VFLGYAAGVGKTYAMLEAARRRKAEGVDLVVALVETHGRAETEALLDGLEVLPRREVTHRGAHLSDLHLDLVLARRPSITLVDELAHTNASESRHPKRWQDVEELLAVGIEVWTTLNVQHLESLADVVAQIVGVPVGERVPDRLLDHADEIELVDVPPEELLQRLSEGKVYVPEQAARATRLFFRPGNLLALRELTLRRAALRVDEQMRAYMARRSIPGPWPAAERLLVSVAGSPYSGELIRATRRLADELRAEWFAVYVETAESDRLSEENRQRIFRDLALAEQLGGRVATLRGASVAEAVLRFARAHNVTKLVVGRPSRRGLLARLKRSVFEDLLVQAAPVDLVVVSVGAAESAANSRRVPSGEKPAWRPVVDALALVGAATALGLPLAGRLEPTNLVMVYLVAVLVAALRLGLVPALVAAVVSVIAFDVVFVPPRHSVTVHDTQYLITFLGLFLVGAVTSTLVSRLRDQTAAARAREAQTAALLSLTRRIVPLTRPEEVARCLLEEAGQASGLSGLVLAVREPVEVLSGSPPLGGLTATDLGAARWCSSHGQAAGRGTGTLPAADHLWLAVLAGRDSGVVLGLGVPGTGHVLAPDRRQLVEALAAQAGLAIERAELAAQAREVDLLAAAARLHRAILSSVSHDLRSPLATIVGVLSTLREQGERLGDEARAGLLAEAADEAERLDRVVGGLLDLSRLEAGRLELRREAIEPQELVGAALTQSPVRGESDRFRLDVPPDLPAVEADAALFTQALVNVLHNALKFSPAGSVVEVTARVEGSALRLEVRDHGVGIPEDELERVFEKFYRARRGDAAGGSGLGLALSRGIIDAHAGRVWAERAEGGGTRVVIELPLAGRPA